MQANIVRIYLKACVQRRFFAFLRVGEITCCPRSMTVLQLNQIVKLVDSSGSITGLKITFLDFKHSYNRPNVSITLKRISDICPVQSLLDYFHFAVYQMALFFDVVVTYDGHAVSCKLFTDYLALNFRICGLDTTKYKGHSFRIGAATFAAECGFSDAQIRSMGRWKFDAFRKYIWGPGLCSTT